MRNLFLGLFLAITALSCGQKMIHPNITESESKKAINESYYKSIEEAKKVKILILF
jgi:hypothetical protein